MNWHYHSHRFWVFIFAAGFLLSLSTTEAPYQLAWPQESNNQNAEGQSAEASVSDPSPEVEAAPTETPPPEPTLEERIASAQERQAQVHEEIAEREAALAEIADATEDLRLPEWTNQLNLLRSLDLVEGQLLNELRRQVELKTQLDELEPQPETTPEADPDDAVLPVEETSSFLDLEIARTERIRQEGLRANIVRQVELAQSAYDQAQDTHQQRINERSALIDRAQAVEEAEREPIQRQLQTANLAVRLAAANVRLQNARLENERLAQRLFEKQLERLIEDVNRMERTAVFTEEHLNQQLRSMNDQRFRLEQQLREQQNKLAIANSGLSEARNRALQDPTAAMVEIEAWQTNVDLENVRGRYLSEQMELLQERKNLWRKRYEVFNLLVGSEQLQTWRQESLDRIQALNQEKDVISTNNSNRQSSLAALRSRLEQASERTEAENRWLPVRAQHLQSLIEQHNSMTDVINRTQAMHQKLIDEIEVHAAVLPWNERIEVLLRQEVYHNTVQQWLITLAFAIGFTIFLFMFRWALTKWTRKYLGTEDTVVRTEIANTIHRTKFFFLFGLGVYAATAPTSLFFPMLELPMITLESGESYSVRKIINGAITLLIVLQFAIWASYLVKAWLLRMVMKKAKQDASTLGMISIFNFISQLAVWSVAFLMVASNLGWDITALVTGLGIGGIAVALALQRILGDLLSSLSIVMDKPFVPGDFIIFQNGDYLGTVEHIGIKTTRIRSISGEQIICPNSSLLETQIRNFKRMQERRVTFSIGITYGTPAEKIRMVPKMIRQIIEELPIARFDRAHFARYGDFSLIFDVVFFVKSADFAVYMDVQQKINLDIYKFFEEQGIEFAFPTQTIHLASSGNNQKPGLQAETSLQETAEESAPQRLDPNRLP